ncbi:MAG: hypothetical protein HC802_15930, partial [Caldilineaceae bacterium]|nr:hypothetical protein [Caldilineaceae bacterium]
MNPSNNTKLNERYGTWWRLLPFILPFLVLVTGAIMILASSQRLVNTAVQLAKDDAAMMNWWHEDQRQSLAAQADMLAARVGAGSDLTTLAADVGLPADVGYVAWLDGEKNVQGELNAAAKLGDPANSKLWRFVPAIGKAASDFWVEGAQPYWIAMAPVGAEQGGGAIILQRPITQDTVADLAEIAGRDVLFYTYEEQTPVLSSTPALISDPAWFDSVWLGQVASGQLPQSTLSQNSQGPLIAGMTAFYDFARISYSGYLGLLESADDVRQVLPMQMFWIVLAVAFFVTVAGAWILHSSMRSYLSNHQSMDYRARGKSKRKLILGVLLLLVPGVLAVGFIMVRTSNESARPDLRRAEIGGAVLVESMETLVARLQNFAFDADEVAVGHILVFVTDTGLNGLRHSARKRAVCPLTAQLAARMTERAQAAEHRIFTEEDFAVFAWITGIDHRCASKLAIGCGLSRQQLIAITAVAASVEAGGEG